MTNHRIAQRAADCKMKSQKNINGYKLEKFVEQLYKEMGYLNVKRNNIIRKGNETYQIDLSYIRIENNLPKKIMVEIKYKDNGRKIELQEVSKFYSVLELIGHNSKNSEFITNSYFTERASLYAKRKGIKMIDGAHLKELSISLVGKKTIQKTIAYYYRIKSFFKNVKQGRISDAITALSSPQYKGNLDEQIRKVTI